MVKSLKPTKEDGAVHHVPVPPPNRWPDADSILYFAGRLAVTAKAKREASKAHDMVRKQFAEFLEFVQSVAADRGVTLQGQE